jgi:hypothetical protein
VSKRESITGGCLCGAVRYAATAAPSDVSYCHCRMCQQHFGNPVGVYASFPDHQVRFTKGTPKNYRSSEFGQRGFCADCGTPLTYTYVRRPEQISVSVGSLDHPERFPPSVHWGIEGQVPWLHIDDGLPRRHTDDDPEMAVYGPGTGAMADCG